MNRNRRSGFTLIEILVVIAIIAILAGLLMAGVMWYTHKGPEVQNKNDLLQINTGLQNFKATYKRYPPSLFRVRAKLSDYTTAPAPVDQLDRESAAFIASMFPSLPPGAAIPWAGSTPIPAGGILLEGDQCLVFFLGGPPVSNTASAGLMGGFTVDPTNPATGSGARKKSMDFPVARLINRGNHPFPSFVDAYGQEPFLYFSSNNRSNGYIKSANSLGVTPYAKDATLSQFYHPDSYQVLSAGPNKLWGAGGFWQPSTTGNGSDDVSNFSEKALGVQ